jgi:hypothetical protein
MSELFDALDEKKNKEKMNAINALWNKKKGR